MIVHVNRLMPYHDSSRKKRYGDLKKKQKNKKRKQKQI